MFYLKLITAWTWFFLLLLSYYILKPLRDGEGSILANQLDRWYLATFIFIVLVMMIYARLVARLSISILIFVVYQFFAACLLGFALIVMTHHTMPTWCVGAFFVWVGVFNVCSVALFWSVLTDLFSKDEAKAWFGVIAGAGSLGAIAGSYATMQLISLLGQDGLLFASFAILQLGFVCGWLFVHFDRMAVAKSVVEIASTSDEDATNATADVSANKNSFKEPEKISLWRGMQRVISHPFLLLICLYILFAKFSATYIYNNLQLAMKTGVEEASRRTELFAQMNLMTQVGSGLFQYVFVGLLIAAIGLRATLIVPSLVIVALFGVFSWQSSLMIMMAAQVIQQIVGYGIVSPTQNMLFTVVPREDKYVAKGFIDTFVFRLGDVVSSKLSTMLATMPISFSSISMALIPCLGIWVWISSRLGGEFQKKESSGHIE